MTDSRGYAPARRDLGPIRQRDNRDAVPPSCTSRPTVLLREPQALLPARSGPSCYREVLDGEHSGEEATAACVCFARKSMRRCRIAGYLPAKICAARRPAFSPPPIATVATGMPFGICTIDSKESSPRRFSVGIGTPITGRWVL